METESQDIEHLISEDWMAPLRKTQRYLSVVISGRLDSQKLKHKCCQWSSQPWVGFTDIVIVMNVLKMLS